jgi:hypothetical protein
LKAIETIIPVDKRDAEKTERVKMQIQRERESDMHPNE